jgi:hypothetical protein
MVLNIMRIRNRNYSKEFEMKSETGIALTDENSPQVRRSRR